MKKMIVALMGLVLSFSAFSKNVELKISSKWKKGNVTKTFNSKVIAKLGTEWEIPFEGKDSLKLKMKATDHFDDPRDIVDRNMAAIMLEGQVIELENGKEKIVGSPKVITVIGKEAMITTESDNGGYLELKILPVKMTEKI